MSATGRGAIRIDSDFYPTPMKSFIPLVPYLPSRSVIWEPACGDFRLVAAMRSLKIEAYGDDISKTGYDFLSDNSNYECILTNPPFSLAMEFCEHAVSHADAVFLLLRLNFLASRKRAKWFKANEPSALFVLSERPSFTGHGTDACDYAWFGWGTTHKGIYHL